MKTKDGSVAGVEVLHISAIEAQVLADVCHILPDDKDPTESVENNVGRIL